MGLGAIRKAQISDVAAIAGLLRRADLPLQGLDSTKLQMFVKEDQARIVGAVALEPYMPYALLRSLVVDPRERSKGHGGQLIRFLVDYARDNGFTTLYGLTTTIPDWLTRLGFEEIPKDQIARPVHQSEELRGACPSTARAFRLRVREATLKPATTVQKPQNPTTRF